MADEVLEDLPYDELRERAFAVAEQRPDIGFFFDLMNHTAALNAAADEGGSLGRWRQHQRDHRRGPLDLRQGGRRRPGAAVPRPVRDVRPLHATALAD